MSTTRTSIASAFALLRARGEVGLLPFIPAGYPDLQTTRAILPALEAAGASAIEIGFPFSDPIADGPVIQEAFTTALAAGVKVAHVFSTIAAVRPAVSIPLVAMVSFSIVYRYGVERFIAEARKSGFDGILMPDLPPPEACSVCGLIRNAGLDTILLVSPTTSPSRRAEIVRLCSGFVYYLSVTGITGERDQLPPDVEKNLSELRAISQVPVCVGFGISKRQHVLRLAACADGVIVGSAFVRRIKENAGRSPAQIASAVGDYCRELLGREP